LIDKEGRTPLSTSNTISATAGCIGRFNDFDGTSAWDATSPKPVQSSVTITYCQWSDPTIAEREQAPAQRRNFPQASTSNPQATFQIDRGNRK